MCFSCLFLLQDVRPTVFMGVPKVWETFKEAAELQLNQLQGLKGYLFEKAKVHVHVHVHACMCLEN